MQWYWIVIYFINLLVTVFNVKYIFEYRSSHKDFIKYVEWYKNNKNKEYISQEGLWIERGVNKDE